MNFLVIIIAKISYLFLKIKHNGSAYPGGLALKMNKDILKYFKLPKVVFVTGTTGKGSVVSNLKKIYTDSGYSVTCNYKGSNLINGVTTALILDSKLSGKIKTDIVILEIDERYVKEVSKYIEPDYFIINNLSRDQLARNGHFGIVFDEINKSISSKTTLILNADDSLVMRFSIGKENKIIYFGVEENKKSTKSNLINTLDQGYCPICHRKLEYSYFNYGNLGNYKCPKGDFIRPLPNFEAKVFNRKFDVDDISINLPNKAIFNVYNLLASYSLAITDGLSKEKVVESLNNIHDLKRFTEFDIKGKKGVILLSKNETPLSYNQSIQYIKEDKQNKTVGIGFTRISGRYDLKDLSWLYDINFELLNDKSIDKFILIGPFAYDLAVRLKLAGVAESKFIYCLDHTETVDYILKYSKDYFYGMFYFDMDYYFKDEMEAYK